MDNEVLQFRHDLLDDVARDSEANSEIKYTSFVNVFMEYLSEAGLVNDFTYSHYKRPFKAGRRNARVDGYSENIFEETVSLVIADFYDEEEPITLTKTDAIKNFNECKAFVEESFNGNLRYEIDKSDPAYYLTDLLNKGNDKGTIRKVKVFLISDKIRSSAAKTIEPDMLGDVTIEYSIWTVDRVFENIRDEGETRDIKFSDYGGAPIRCLEIKAGKFPGYMCAMPGELLANLYERLDTELLEGNIRSFLSTKVAVNSGIRKTIVNEPDRFFIYNNGISATASDVHLEKKDGQLFMTGIVDFQIVNGGQTTASLYNSRFKDKSDLGSIFVPMKLTVVEKENAKDVIPLIAEYANTQNRVSSADFFSNHEFCIKMERYSRTCRIEAQNGEQYEQFWFFERAKGQYTQAQLGKTKAEINKFKLRYPKDKLFTKTDLAKFRNSWDQMPDTVSKGAQTNFQKFVDSVKVLYEKNPDEYNERYYKETVALGILFRRVEKIVSSQEWYQQGYRAQIVTYSIALFSKLMQEQYPGYPLDLMWIWRNQMVPKQVEAEFINITKIANDLINDPNRTVINVTQWCKREACWSNVKKSCHYEIDKAILSCCTSKEEQRSSIAAAKRESKTEIGILAETEVVEYGAENWSRLYDFAIERRLPMTVDQRRAIHTAMRIPSKIPNSYQSKILMELRELALNEGFKK